MEAKLKKIIEDLIVEYEAAPEADGQTKANGLVLIQTAIVNLTNFYSAELGKAQIETLK